MNLGRLKEDLIQKAVRGFSRFSPDLLNKIRKSAEVPFWVPFSVFASADSFAFQFESRQSFG